MVIDLNVQAGYCQRTQVVKVKSRLCYCQICHFLKFGGKMHHNSTALARIIGGEIF